MAETGSLNGRAKSKEAGVENPVSNSRNHSTHVCKWQDCDGKHTLDYMLEVKDRIMGQWPAARVQWNCKTAQNGMPWVKHKRLEQSKKDIIYWQDRNMLLSLSPCYGLIWQGRKMIKSLCLWNAKIILLENHWFLWEKTDHLLSPYFGLNTLLKSIL